MGVRKTHRTPWSSHFSNIVSFDVGSRLAMAPLCGVGGTVLGSIGRRHPVEPRGDLWGHAGLSGWTLFLYGGFPKWGTPIAGWFTVENHTKIDDDWGYPCFRKPPYGIVMDNPLRGLSHQGCLKEWFDWKSSEIAEVGNLLAYGIIEGDVMTTNDLCNVKRVKVNMHWNM